MPKDSPLQTVKVAVVLCLVCSVAVSSAAVLLKPLQERNQARAMRAEILKVAEMLDGGRNINELFEERITTRIVDLESGEYADSIDPTLYDQRVAARNPMTSTAVAPEQDIASIKRRADYAPVYLVGNQENPDTIILPVRGYGLWSTMHGFLALDGDGNTIKGISFYEHGETAGLGSEIESPRWQAEWVGKEVFDETGAVRFQVAKGNVDPSAPGAEYRVDGLSGATLTANGVTNLMRYWMGEQGFGNYLDRFQ